MADQDRDIHQPTEKQPPSDAAIPSDKDPAMPEPSGEMIPASEDGDPTPEHETNGIESDEAASEKKDLPVEAPLPTEPQDSDAGDDGEKKESASEAENETSEPKQEEKEDKKDWFILKVQVNRENAIRDSLARRVAIAGLEEHFGEILVPTEKVTEFRSGRKRVVKKKLYPGYIVVHMEITDDTWFLVRETPGIGDFTGTHGKPTPMQPHEVTQILATEQEEEEGESPKLKIGFKKGDRVKVKSGTFEDLEGTVDEIDPTSGRVKVMITIFNRSTPVELDYWLIEKPD